MSARTPNVRHRNYNVKMDETRWQDVMLNPSVDTNQRLVYLALCMFADGRGLASPDLGPLADMAGLSEETTASCLDCLVNNGLLRRTIPIWFGWVDRPLYLLTPVKERAIDPSMAP